MSVGDSSVQRRVERRATLDNIMNNPLPRGASEEPTASTTSTGPESRASYIPNGGGHRSSGYYEDDRHRKSRIGGMFKKMFKKDEQQ